MRDFRRSNSDVGGRVVKDAETEYMVEGIGDIEWIEEIGQAPRRLSDYTSRSENSEV